MKNRRIIKPFLESLPRLNPQPWVDMSAGQLEQLRAAADGVVRQSRTVGRIVAGLVWLALVGGMGLLMLQTPGQGRFELIVMLALFAASAGAILALLINMTAQGGLGGMDAGYLRAMLRPLNEQEGLCAEAVGWLQYPTVRGYRNMVLEQGRELVLADHTMMRVLAGRERAREQHAISHQACQMLHGLQELPAASGA